ncbi:MAG: hypothetical protein ABJE80_22895 [Reichenbachiella sp.]|uniref:hypothetical protein n=1 Tax=Reichenbachiella sp. TaxID=2184521 RepID=UPI0032672485
MEINVDDINLGDLDIGAYGYSVLQLVIAPALKQNQKITDEMYSYIVNPPAIYACADDEAENMIEKAHERHVANKGKSLKLVELIKKEFYEFMCTESDYYKKERSTIGGNINVLITGVSAAIATKVGNVEIGVITSFVVCFITVLSKMGKRAMCEYFKA